MQHHIFLSYSRKDAEFMGRVRASLTNAGLTVWTGESLTPGSEAWQLAMEQAIDNSGCVVLLLSPGAKESRGLMSELRYAVAHRVKVFPVLVEGDARSAVPDSLMNTPLTDLRLHFDTEMRGLISTIREHLTSIQTDTIPNRPTQMIKVPRPREAQPIPWRWIAVSAGMILVAALVVLLINRSRNASISALPTIAPPVLVFTQTAVSSVTNEPTDTPTDTETPTRTSTPTPATPIAQPVRDVVARTGPGSGYPAAATVPAENVVAIVGVSEDGSWLKVRLADGTEAWLTASSLVVAQFGDVRNVPVVIMPTDTPTPTATNTPSSTPTRTPTSTRTFTPTPTSTPSPTATPTRTPRPTRTPTNTPAPSHTPTASNTPRPTSTPTQTPTRTPIPTATATPRPQGDFPYVNGFDNADALAGWAYDRILWKVVNDSERGKVLQGRSRDGSLLDAPLVVMGNARQAWSKTNDMVIRLDLNIQSDNPSIGARLILRASAKGYYVLEFFQGTIALRRGEKPIGDGMNRDSEALLRTDQLSFDNNQWHHVTLWSGEHRLYIYVDGRLIDPPEGFDPALPAGKIGLQVVGSKPVLFDNLVIEQPGESAEHFDGEDVPGSWTSTDEKVTAVRSESNGNRYLWIGREDIVSPQTSPLNDSDIHCRIWIEKGGYQIRLAQDDGIVLDLAFDGYGGLIARLLDKTGKALWTSDTLRNLSGRNAWADLDFAVQGDHFSLYSGGMLRVDATLPQDLSGLQLQFLTGASDAIRLDDCLILSTN